MNNKDIDRLIQAYIKGYISYEKLISLIDELEKKDKPNIVEPPIIY